MNYDITTTAKFKLVYQLAAAGFDEGGCVFIMDMIEKIDQRTSGSGIKYLGDDVFLIYDYPMAEEWLIKDCIWQHTLTRLGDGTFHLVCFVEPKASVEFKLRWGRELEERKQNA